MADRSSNRNTIPARVSPRPGASENRACELTAKIVALLIILYASGVVGLFIYDHLLQAPTALRIEGWF